jgi:hypothetical protein
MFIKHENYPIKCNLEWSEILRPFKGPFFCRNIEQDFYEDLIGFVQENEPLWRKTSSL